MKAVRGLIHALNSDGRFKYKDPADVVDFLVVGGGVVGLSIAQRIAQVYPKKSLYLVERHESAGQETSSRNSEVIHSGLFYPKSSLKTRLCIRGRDLLYARCKSHAIPFRQTGKLVLAQRDQLGAINALHAHALSLNDDARGPKVLATQVLSGDQARKMELDLGPNIAFALWVPQTGIVDSHALMSSLETELIEAENAQLVYNTRVVRVDPHTSSGWVVQLQQSHRSDADTDTDTDAILARTLITATGLAGPHILNATLPPSSRIPTFYARGSYATYSGSSGVRRSRTMLYPCPASADGALQSLGTHLTHDLAGGVKFGPDLEWIEPHGEGDPDFWRDYLRPEEGRLQAMHAAITTYLPGVVLSGLQPGYVGIRPKLVGPDGGFSDFVIRTDAGGTLVSCLGIESPGLTASLGIAEMVVDEMLRVD